MRFSATSPPTPRRALPAVTWQGHAGMLTGSVSEQGSLQAGVVQGGVGMWGYRPRIQTLQSGFDWNSRHWQTTRSSIH